MTPEEHFRSIGITNGFAPKAGIDPVLIRTELADGLENAIKLDKAAEIEEITHSAYEKIRLQLPKELGHIMSEHERADLYSNREITLNKRYAKKFSRQFVNEIVVENKKLTITSNSIDQFIGDITSATTFNAVRLPHGFWDTLNFLEELENAISSLEPLSHLNQDEIRSLSIRMGRHIRGRIDNFSECYIDDVLAAISDSDFISRSRIAIAFKGYPTHDERIYHTGKDDDQRLLKRLRKIIEAFPDTCHFDDGMQFKRWAISGDLNKLFSAVKHEKIIMIGPEAFNDISKRLLLEDVEYFKIPDFDVQDVRYQIYDEVTAACKKSIDKNGLSPLILTQSGGSFVFWLSNKLLSDHPQLRICDIGGALDIYAMDRVKGRNWLKIYFKQIMENSNLRGYYERLSDLDPYENIMPIEIGVMGKFNKLRRKLFKF